MTIPLSLRKAVVETPIALIIPRQLLTGKARPEHLDRHRSTDEISVVKCLLGELARVDELVMQRAKLKPPHHVGQLVKGRGHRCPPHFGFGVGALMADFIHQEFDALFRRPSSELIVQ